MIPIEKIIKNKIKFKKKKKTEGEREKQIAHQNYIPL